MARPKLTTNQIKTRIGDGVSVQTANSFTALAPTAWDANGKLVAWSGAAPGTSGIYHIVGLYSGLIPGAQLFFQWVCPADLTSGVLFPGNFGGFAHGFCQAAPASTYTITLYKVTSGTAPGNPADVGTAVGTITISTSGTFSFATSSGAALSFTAGDTFAGIGQSSADATLSTVSFTLPGTR